MDNRTYYLYVDYTLGNRPDTISHFGLLTAWVNTKAHIKFQIECLREGDSFKDRVFLILFNDGSFEPPKRIPQ